MLSGSLFPAGIFTAELINKTYIIRTGESKRWSRVIWLILDARTCKICFQGTAYALLDIPSSNIKDRTRFGNYH